MYMNNMQTRSCNCNANKMYHNDVEMGQFMTDTDDMMENGCPCLQNVLPANYDACECGFENDSKFPANAMYAQSYVPWQTLDKTFTPCVGKKMGTLFPELVSPYSPGQSQEEINYIAMQNKIGMGCNKC